MSNTIRAAIIPASESQPVRVVHLDTGIQALQNAVGGWVEAVGTEEATIWLDEEGKLANKAPNYRATKLARTLGVGLKVHDVIAGDAVVTGFDHDTGENADVPASAVDALGATVQA